MAEEACVALEEVARSCRWQQGSLSNFDSAEETRLDDLRGEGARRSASAGLDGSLLPEEGVVEVNKYN